MSSVDPTTEKSDDDEHVCVVCQLRNALTDWQESGGSVDEVVFAINDMVQRSLGTALDEIFTDDEPKKVTDLPAGHG